MLRSKLFQICCSSITRNPSRLFQQKTEKSINQVTLLGRVGRDVELKGSDEHPMASFTMATSEHFRGRQQGDEEMEYQQKTSWHRICIFKPGLLNTVYTYCKKGDRIYVSGRLDYNEYTNSEGVKVYQTNVVADDVIFLGESGR